MDAQETQVFIFLLIAITVVATIITFFFVSLVRQQRINLELKKKNLTAEINSLEKDRARIARDLHDEIAPILSAVSFRIGTFDLEHEEDRRQQQKSREHLDEVMQRMREISFDLMPATLQRKGLVAALQELASFTSHRNRLQIELAADPLVVHPPLSIHLYRIAQEIIHNTLKHAEATLLQLELKSEDRILVFSAKDNGKGFRYEEALEASTGFGLRNLLSRADLLGGSLFVDSREGKGTLYCLEIPLT